MTNARSTEDGVRLDIGSEFVVTPNGVRLSCGALKKNDSFP